MKPTQDLLLLALVIIIGSCRPKPLEPSVPIDTTNSPYDKPSQIQIILARDPYRYNSQYTYNNNGLLTRCETSIDTNENSKKEILLVSDYQYNIDNTLSKKDSKLFKNSYLTLHEEDYLPKSIKYSYENKLLTKVENEPLTIQYFYKDASVFDYILIDSNNITKDSIDISYSSNGIVQTYNFRTFKGKGLNFNGDTGFHGYKAIGPLLSYSYDQENNKFLVPQSGMTYQFSTLPIKFQKEVLRTFQELLFDVTNASTSLLAYQLMPNFYSIHITQWFTQYKFDYITDNEGRVVHITEWAPGPNDGLVLSRLIDIKY